MIEQLFDRNAKFAHSIFKCEIENFKVYFRKDSKSVFLVTFDQQQKQSLDSVKLKMIEKLKRSLCGASTLKVSYMLPKEQINEYKSIIRQCNGQTKEFTTIYSEEVSTDCDFSYIIEEESKLIKYIKKEYELINYEFYFKSPDDIPNFEKKLDEENQKSDSKGKGMELVKFKVIQNSIKYPDELKEDHYEDFIEYAKDKINGIRKKLKLIELIFGQDEIKIRGTKSSIKKFSKIPKEGEEEENSLNYLVTDFNKNQVSSKEVELDENKFFILVNFPGIFYTPSILNKVKKIEILKLIDTNTRD